MIRIAVTGDWHIPSVSEVGGELHPSGLPQRFVDYAETAEQTIQDMLQACPGAIFVAGDLFRGVGNEADADQVRVVADALAKAGHAVPVYVIPGNHDGARDLTRTDTLGFLEDVAGVRIRRGIGHEKLLGGTRLVAGGVGRDAYLNIVWCQYFSPEMVRGVLAAPAETRAEELRERLRAALWAEVAACDPSVPTVLLMHQGLTESRLTAARTGLLGAHEVTLSVNDLPPVAAVVSGHIHLPQVLRENPLIVHPGAIERVDFGERDDPRTWGLIEIDGGDDVTYETFPTRARALQQFDLDLAEDALAMQGPWDVQAGALVRVVVRAPEGAVTFADREAVTAALEAAGAHSVEIIEQVVRHENRHESEVSQERTPWENVVAAAAETDTELTALHEKLFAQALAAASRARTRLMGQPLRPLRLQVEGFTSLSGVDLDLTEVGVAAVGGPNGAGKSSLVVDAPIWCLTGANLRGGRATDHDRLLTVGQNAMRVAMEFGSPNGTYRVERSYRRSATGKTATSSLLLQQAGPQGWDNLSGSTLDETQGKLNALFGLGDDAVGVLTRTCMLPQGGSDAFAKASARDRKALLAELLGLDAWDELCEALRTSRSDVEREAAQVQGAHDALAEEAGPDALQRARETAADLAVAARADEYERDAAREAAELSGQALEWARGGAQEAQRRWDEAQALRVRLATEQEALQAAQGVLEAHLAQDTQAAVVAAEAEVAVAVGEGQLAEEGVKWLAAARDAREKTAMRLAEAEVKAATEYAAAMEAHSRVVARNSRRMRLRERVAELRRARYQELHRVDEAARKTLLQHQQDAQLLGEVPCGEHADMQDACPLLARARQSAALAAQVDADMTTRVEALVRANELSHRAARRAEVDAARPVPERPVPDDTGVGDLKKTLVAADQDVASLAHWEGHHTRAQEDLIKARRALAEAAAQAARYDEKRVALEDGETALRDRCHAMAQELAGYGDAAGELVRAQDVLAQAMQADGQARARLERAQEALARAQARAEQATAQVADLEAKAARLQEAAQKLADLRATTQALNDLVRLTGPDGVVARLLDEAIPLAEQAANEVLQLVSDGRMGLALISRALTKSGTVKETLDIAISTPEGERLYEQFSGGERMRVDLALIVGLSRLTAAQSGSHLQWVVLDEMCAPLDVRGREQFVEAIGRLAEIYPLVLVITHLEDVMARFGQRITVERHNGAAEVRRVA